jgi:hypothetical protein
VVARSVALTGAVLIAVVVAVGCASGPSGSSDARVTLRVDDVVAWDGPAAYAVRVEGRDARAVVSVIGVGEVLVGDDACRFARLDGAGALSVWRHAGACAARRGERLCFRRAAFTDDAGVVRAVVDGCADQNELFLARIDAAATAGLGPRTLVERCVDVRAADAGYVRVAEVVFDDNDQRLRGLRLRHDGEAFGVCFLSRPRGRYRVEVVVEDPRPRRVVLQGEVDEL